MSACVQNSNNGSEVIEEDSLPVVILSDITESAHEFADSVLREMSLEEKIGQCLMPSINAESDPYTMNYLRDMIDTYHIGGIVLMQGDSRSAEKIGKLGAESRIPLFISIDAEWGLGMRLKDAPVFPKNGRITKDADEILLFDYGREVADECRDLGINMVLGPVVDISEYYTGIIGRRSFGGDPERVASLGVAYSKGLESGGIISVAKHFPGHGSSVTDSHYKVVKVSKSISALDTIDFHPFKEYINSGLSGIMAGHIQVPSLSPNKEPAAVSVEILTGLLRDEMGFKGLVLTDAFNMGGARGFSASDAISAGADIVLSPSNIKKVFLEIKKKIENGELSETIINERCENILFHKALFGLWNNIDKETTESKISSGNAEIIKRELGGR